MIYDKERDVVMEEEGVEGRRPAHIRSLGEDSRLAKIAERRDGNGRNRKEEIKRADSLKDYILKDDGIIIEAFGPPKSGKTWQVERAIQMLVEDPEFIKLRPDFNYRVYKYSIKDERSKDDRYRFHMAYVTNHYENLDVVRLNRKHSEVRLIPLDLVVSERGPTDDNSFSHTWHEEGKITTGQRDKALGLSMEAESWVNASFLVYVPPEVALGREDEKTLEVFGYTRRGEVMNEHTLEVLCHFYDLARKGEFYKTVEASGKRWNAKLARKKPIFINGEHPDPYENVAYFKDELFKLFVPTIDEYRNGPLVKQEA